MLHRLSATGLHYETAGPFDLTVASGQCLAVTGPSGAGKSLLLRMLADLIPHAGSCAFDGVDSQSIPVPQWRRHVRYCAAEPGWWAPTIADHFTDPAAIRAACPSLALDPALLDAAPERLSTGERQRLALLRGLEDRPDFLLLDEPSSALDHASTLLLEKVVSDAKANGMGIVLVSHDRAQVTRLADIVLEVSKP